MSDPILRVLGFPRILPGLQMMISLPLTRDPYGEEKKNMNNSWSINMKANPFGAALYRWSHKIRMQILPYLTILTVGYRYEYEYEYEYAYAIHINTI